MKKLKSYIDGYGYLVDDKTIILKYITDNNLEQEYIELISKLAKSKVEKLEGQMNQKNFIIESSAAGLESLLKQYKKDIALFLLDLQLCYACTFDFTENLIEKAKEIIPTIDYPQWYFRDVPTHLYQKYGIKFKNHKEDMVGSYLNKRYE